MNYYILRPDLTPYEGIKVDKDTKLTFKNEKVFQKIEGLKLFIKRKTTGNGFKEESKITVELKEGDILLFERENRGYFKPIEPIGTIETGIKDLKALALALDGEIKDDTRTDEKEGIKTN